jgi:hypothetical protein
MMTNCSSDSKRTDISGLPSEVISYILQYVPDKMGCYFTCKWWGVCLEQMFKQGHLSDINDSYYLMKRFEKKINITISEIYTIYNHNSLNFLFFQRKEMFPYPLTLLRQNYVTNNISRPNYLLRLFDMVKIKCPSEITILLNILFEKKFYVMVKLFSKYEPIANSWISSFVSRNMNCDINDDIKDEITTLIHMGIITPEVAKRTTQVLRLSLNLKQQLLLFIKDTYNI